MAPRRFRPRDFADFEKRTGWGTGHAFDLVGRLGGVPREQSEAAKRGEAGSREELIKLANRYHTWFVKAPNKTHVFPLLGTLFQYEFARGVRDAIGLKTRLRSMVVTHVGEKGIIKSQHAASAKKLGLAETDIVMHDYIHGGRTGDALAEAMYGNPHDERAHFGQHYLEEPKMFANADIPLPNGSIKHLGVHTSFEPSSRLYRKVNATIREEPQSAFTPSERTFIKRAVYAAGFAAAKELMKKEGKV